jgi:hypothetical protein
MRAFGLGRWAARGLVRQLRRPVTDTVCRLLPGVERATGMRWQFMAENLLAPMVLLSLGKLHPTVAPEQLSTARFAVGMLYPVTDELRIRHDALEPEPLSRCRPSSSVPSASAELVRLRATAVQVTDLALNDYYPSDHWQRIRRVQAVTVRAAVGDGPDSSWGAWTFFASVMALYLHREELPEPGRTAASRRPGPARDRAVDAGLSFLSGRMLLLGAALGMLDLVEEATST